MKEVILNYIKENNHPITIEELSNNLKTDENIVENIMKELINEQLIYKDENHKYEIIPKDFYIERLKSCSRNNKFILINNKKIFIEKENLHSALNNDLILVELDKKNKGIVRSILERKNNRLVCEVIEKKGIKKIVTFNNSCGVELTYDQTLLNELVCGDRICAIIDDNIDKDNIIKITNYKKIGHKDDPQNDEICISISKDFDIDFSEEAIKELDTIPTSVSDEEKKDRLDLTNELIFTIDSEKTKDIDDAISLKKLFNGNYLLSVHIADVSHYIKPNMALYKDAKKRGTSVYLGNSVIPILPHKLSNGICSLNEASDRLAKSCIMEINPQGKIINSKMAYSVINSKKKMTYENINKILNLESVPEGYEPFVKNLFLFKEFSEIINKSKHKRGALEFASSEIKPVFNEKKKEFDFETRFSGVGEEIIENCMILTNEAIATTYFWKNLPFIYRIHDTPNENGLDKTIEIIKSINNKLNKIKETNGIETLKIILDKLSDDKDFQIFSNMLLRNMSKAKYSSENIGHFAQALDNYCHFTSPIRRFPDLEIHTLIDMYTFDKNYKEKLNILKENLNKICEHSSYKERQADEAEKDYLKLKMAKYMENHIGEEFDGTIISIDNTNILVKLNNNVIGLIDIFNGFTDTFDIDNLNKEIKSKYSKQKMTLGTKIRIKVTGVNINQKEILFDLKYIYKDYEKKLELNK